MENILFLFFSIFFVFLPIKSTYIDEATYAYTNYEHSCNPTPINIEFQTLGKINQKCKGLEILPGLENQTQRSFKCCEVIMKKKEGSGPDFNGCIAIMKSYVDDDRYEDILDYFRRGKQYKLQNYFVMLGKSSYEAFQYYLARVNGTKYNVEKLDCFSRINVINILFILAILFFIY